MGFFILVGEGPVRVLGQAHSIAILLLPGVEEALLLQFFNEDLLHAVVHVGEVGDRVLDLLPLHRVHQHSDLPLNFADILVAGFQTFADVPHLHLLGNNLPHQNIFFFFVFLHILSNIIFQLVVFEFQPHDLAIHDLQLLVEVVVGLAGGLGRVFYVFAHPVFYLVDFPLLGQQGLLD